MLEEKCEAINEKSGGYVIWKYKKKKKKQFTEQENEV